MQTLKTFLSRVFTFFLIALLPLALSAQLSDLERQQIENFRNPNAAVGIPYQGENLKDFENRENPFNNFVEMKNIAEHPVLSGKAKAKKQKAVQNIGVDDLTELGVLSNAVWGLGTMYEDNSALMFTQDFTVSFTYGSTHQKYYNSTTITFLDENFDSVKSVTIKTPDTTQSIEVFRMFSKKIFNNDDKMEFLVKVHGFASEYWGDGPISCRDTILVINEDGEILKRFGSAGGANIHKVGNVNRLLISRPDYSGVYDSIDIRIYDAKKDAAPLFQYTADRKYFNYSRGPIFEYENISGKEYYISSFYEKYFDSAQNSKDPIISSNNKFIIRMYDALKFGIAKEIKLDIIGQDMHKWSMADLSSFGDFMFTTDVFNDDTLIEIIYNSARYYIDCDCNRNDIYLVNEKGEVLKEILKRTGGTVKLQSLAGQNDEYAVYIGGEDKVEAIKMFEMPTMIESFTFPSRHNGDVLSLTFNRVANNKGSREYVFGLGGGESANGTTYAGIVYYDLQGKKTKHVRIDVGASAALATPILGSNVLTPYLINSTDECEYLFFGKEYTGNGSEIAGYFAIASEAGNVLHKWYNHEQYGKFKGAGIIQNNKQDRIKGLYVNFSGETGVFKGRTSSIFYQLPFANSPMQGEGTRENPYIITNPVQLDMVRNNDSAHYILGNDIDMVSYSGFNGMGLLPLCDQLNKEFRGSLDGKGYSIKNLRMTSSKKNVALFSNLKDSATIKNLFLKNVQIINDAPNFTIGTIAGTISSNSLIENCHVEGNLDVKTTTGKVGGLVGAATMGSALKQCSFTGTIKAPLASSVGGIVGNAFTGSLIIASYTNGSIIAKGSVGGIAGKTMSQTRIESCYSNMYVKGGSSVGGLVGYNQGAQLFKNYATGKVEASASLDKFADKAGGITAETSLGTTGSSHKSGGVRL